MGDWGKGMKGKGGGGGRSARAAARNRGLGRSRGCLGRSQDSGGLDVLQVQLLDEEGSGSDAPCCVGVFAKFIVDVGGVGWST